MTMIVKKLIRDLIPEGTHRARFIWIVDTGWQRNIFEKDPARQLKRQFLFTLELPDLKTSGGQPRLFTTLPFNHSTHETSNLYKLYEQLGLDTNADFDVRKLERMPCKISISHKKKPGGKTFADLDKFFPADPGDTLPEPFYPTGFYDYDQPNKAFLAVLPAFIQRRIFESVDPEETKKVASLPTLNIDETLPF